MPKLIISNKPHRYSRMHTSFVAHYFKLAGWDIAYSNKLKVDIRWVECQIDGKTFVMEFSNFFQREEGTDPNNKIFKWHYNKDYIESGPTYTDNYIPTITGFIHPFTNYREYFALRKERIYTGTKDNIFNFCRSGRVPRRKKVQRILGSRDGRMPNIDFWNKHRKALAAVHVPGHAENVLDRGQLELIGLGIPTISPEIVEINNFNKTFTAGEHYIKCRNDFEDLLEVVEWCKENPKLVKEIGDNAWDFFKWFTPDKYVEWILKNL